MGVWAHAVLACALLCGAQALLPEMPDVILGGAPTAKGAKAAVGLDAGAWGSPAAPSARGARGAGRFLGRLEDQPGYGSYLCYNKGMFDDVPADVADLKRVVLAAPEAVPAAGAAAPTISEVAEWAAAKFGVPAEQLVPEVLSSALSSNDWVDEKGIRHVRLTQHSDQFDMGVDYGAVVVHLANNKVILVTGGIVPDLEGKTSKDVTAASTFISPSEASAAAIRAALSTVPAASKGLSDRLKAAAAAPTAASLTAASAAPSPARVLHCGQSSCRPTYKQVVFLPHTAASSPKELHIYVDATNGKVVYLDNRLRTRSMSSLDANPKRRGQDVLWLSLGRGKSLYAGEVAINTAASTAKAKGGPYQLNDLTQNAMTYDMLNKDDDYFYSVQKDTLFRDKDNEWGDFTPKNRQSAAVDAHWGATTTLYYYKDQHKRIGVDGRGGALKSRVHTSTGFDNAYWSNDQMTYGDGSRDPKTWNTSCEGFPPLTTLDIIAHELTHGVTEYSAGLIYQQSMGGINEAMSDIMSQCVVDYAHETQEYPGKANFLLGAQLYPSGNCPRGFLRSMINPSADNNRSSSCWHPKFDRMFNETHGGNDMWCYVDVHWSSGVANRAFYLAAKGLNQTCDQAIKPAAIGLTSACNIFYRALTSYLSKVADYHELRTATVQAAKDLFGASSPEASSLAQAWDIVGAPRAPYPNTNAPKCQPGFATAASCIRGLV